MTTKYLYKKMKNLCKSKVFLGLLIMLTVSLISFNVNAQEEENSNEPVSNTFESGLLGEMQTTETPYAREFDLQIQHRFGLIDNGFEDVFGIYGSSNIRMGVDYGVSDKFMIGYGYTKEYKIQEFHGKYRLFTQTKNNSIPFSVALYGNLAINSQNKSIYGKSYVFSNRLAYFSQIIVARKLTDKISLQIAPSFSHYNKTDSIEHDKIGISLAGRVKITPSSSIFCEYDQPLNIDKMKEYNTSVNDPEANLSFGIEIGTSMHVFQVFMSNYRGITPQRNMLFNKNKISDGDFQLGFNILVRF